LQQDLFLLPHILIQECDLRVKKINEKNFAIANSTVSTSKFESKIQVLQVCAAF
jgi:hypothetical protein